MRPRTQLTSLDTRWLERRWLGIVWLAAWLIVVPLSAQYNPPGSSVSGTDLPKEEALRKSAEDARLRLGVLRLQPWIGVRDGSFVTGSDDEGSDLTVTVGAGLRAYLKTGSNLVWAAHVLPEYVWWQDNEDRRRLNGRYGVGLFGYFNRLGFEVSARRTETQSFFSPEVQALTSQRRDVGRFGLELQLAKRFFLYGTYSLTDAESLEQESTVFPLLDQKLETARVGVRYRSPKGFHIGVGLGASTTDFGLEARPLSNTETSELFDVGYEGTKLSSGLRIELRSLEGSDGSQLGDFDQTTGYFETRWQVHRSVGFFVYGRRQLGYSVLNQSSTYLSERFGSRVDLSLRDTTLSVAAELGDDEYRNIDPLDPQRIDDVVGLSMTLSFDLLRVFRFNMGLTYTDYDSSLDAFDRDVTLWTASLQLLHERIRLGEAGKTW